MEFAEEDLAVLMKVLVENIGQGSKEHSIAVSRHAAQGNITPGALWQLEEDEVLDTGLLLVVLKKAELLEQHEEVKASGNGAPAANGALAENVVNVLLNFEIQEVGSSSLSSKQQVQV